MDNCNLIWDLLSKWLTCAVSSSTPIFMVILTQDISPYDPISVPGVGDYLHPGAVRHHCYGPSSNDANEWLMKPPAAEYI